MRAASMAVVAGLLTVAVRLPAPGASVAADEAQDSQAPDCAELRAGTFESAVRSTHPDAVLRTHAIQMKQEVRHVETYEAYADKVACLFDDLVRPHLADGVPDLVVYPEYAGLATLGVGSRGAPAREIAEGVFVVSSTALPELARSDDPADVAAIADPDLDDVTEVWVAADARVWNEVHVWAPEPGQTDWSRKRYGELDADDPRSNLIHINRKTPTTPIEQDFLALTEGDMSPENTGPFTIPGVDGLRFSVANSLPAFMWGEDDPDPFAVHHFVGNRALVPDEDPEELELFAGAKGEFVVTAPWVLDEDPSLDVAEDRERLRERARAMLAGSDHEHENGYLETGVWADLTAPGPAPESVPEPDGPEPGPDPTLPATGGGTVVALVALIVMAMARPRRRPEAGGTDPGWETEGRVLACQDDGRRRAGLISPRHGRGASPRAG